jgi:hypothetical protein
VAKNRLSAADGQQVEEAFAVRLAVILEQSQESGEATTVASDQSLTEKTRTLRIDKGGVLFPEPRRLRDRDHVRHVIRQPCLNCGRRPSDAHHLRFAQSRALGRKVSDEFTVPLCRGHHQVHRSGDEAIWWKKAANGDFACWPIPMPLQFVAALVQSEKRKSRR